ncbi:MAG TPA: hypothetical protein VNX01_02550 [Bacteroidia bacterium]|jgi:hypothetical protein|nr:hypothetical protein [Bacteroidia bacterium]
MDKASLNLVCCAIALSGGNEELISIVRSLNEGVNYENFNELMKFTDKKFIELSDSISDEKKGILAEKELRYNANTNITDNGSSVILRIDDKEIANYHKSQQH